jgi:hypothetical protein
MSSGIKRKEESHKPVQERQKSQRKEGLDFAPERLLLSGERERLDRLLLPLDCCRTPLEER